MASAVHSSSSANVAAGNARISKKTDVLPVPSTTPAARKGTAASQKLAMILQYLNPLFYARIAQSFIYSVLESYKGTGAATLNAPRLTAGEADHEFGAAPTSLEAANYDVSELSAVEINDEFTTEAPEFEYLPHLNLSMTAGAALMTQSTFMGESQQKPGLSEPETACTSATADAEPQAEASANQPAASFAACSTETTSSKDNVLEGLGESKDAESNLKALDLDDVKHEATTDVSSNQGDASDNAKKNKRNKNKNKSKSKSKNRNRNK